MMADIDAARRAAHPRYVIDMAALTRNLEVLKAALN